MILLRNRICVRKLSAIGVLGEARQANRVTRHNGVNLVYNARRPVAVTTPNGSTARSRYTDARFPDRSHP